MNPWIRTNPGEPPAASSSTRPFPQGLSGLVKGIGFLALVAFLLFKLPYLFPSQRMIASNSVNMGFSNGVAMLAVWGLVGLLTIVRHPSIDAPRNLLALLPSRDRDQRAPEHVPMWKGLPLLVLGIYLGAACLLYWALPALEEYGEAGYFLHRTGLILQYGSVPYKDIEFGYGPALIYLPVGFAKLGHRLGFSLAESYLACYSMLCVVGVWLLFFVIDSLGLPRRHRTVMFSVLSGTLFSISMGLQYLIVRFMLVPALLLGLHGSLPVWVASGSRFQRWKAWSLCTLAALVALSVSPEAGLVFVACQGVGFCYRLGRSERGYWPCLLFTLVAIPICWLIFTPSYLASVFMFAQGGANFPLVPSLFAVLFLWALFFTLPSAVDELRSHPQDPQSPLLLALILHPLFTLPAALGRGDAGHILFNGLGLFILTFALLARRSRPAFRWFTIAMLVVFGLAAQSSAFWLYADYLKPVAAAFNGRTKPREGVSPVPALLKLEGLPGVATPLGVDRSTEDQLRAMALYVPLYYPDTFNLGTPEHVNRQVQDLEKVKFILIPVEFLQFRSTQEIDCLWMNAGVKRQLEESQQLIMRRALFYPVTYRIVRKPYLPDLEIAKYILVRYSPIRVGGGYALMIRKATDRSSGTRSPLTSPEG